jgi:hypothetical protein
MIELQTTRTFYLWEKESLARLQLVAAPLEVSELNSSALSKPMPIFKPKLTLEVIGCNYFSFAPEQS